MNNYKPKPLEKGCYYHIYNRGNNGIDIFFDTESYYYFLKLFDKYITPIADTFAWCLLKNHFHILVYLKLDNEIDLSKLEYSTVDKPKILEPSYQFSHFFNAYTQAINKKFNRTGSLLEKPFERKKILSEKYLKNVIYYIHNNPVQHGFVKNINLYPWSSYGTIISEKTTKLKRDEVINIYGSKSEFTDYHTIKHNINDIDMCFIE
jgi:putative transposase